METVHPMEAFRQQVKPALKSKVEEFHMLGYDRATEDDLWACLIKKKWRKKEEKRLYEVVNDILTLSANDFMAFLSVQALSNDWFADKDLT
jgi:hypothetical protein